MKKSVPCVRTIIFGHRLLFLAIALALVFSTLAFAQRDLGTITGTVTDAQSAVVPNVKITITEVATGLKYEVTTGSGGEYTRPALKPGTYSVAAEAKGFRRAEQDNVVVTGGDRVGVNLVLAVGDITQSVEVSAEAPLLQTEGTTLGAELNTAAVSELPLGGQRTFSYLARLSPGVLTAEPGARDATGGGFSANGVRSNGQDNFLLNGVDNNVNVIDFLNQTSFVMGPSVEAIGEMNVLTNGYNAEYGRGAGGVVSVSLKSGTNQLHGVAFLDLQRRGLDANRWENNESGTPRGPYSQNQFGLAVGGPIIKNRTFIFGDYQGTRISSSGGIIGTLGNAGYYTIPTSAMKSGDFSGLLPEQLYDPTTTTTNSAGVTSRTPFPNNMIPTSKQDPVAQKLIALYPGTNQPVASGKYPVNDLFVDTPGAQNTDQGDVRVDHRLSDKDSLFGSLSWNDTYKTAGQPLPGALDGATFNGVPETDLSRNAMISWARVWEPTIISETRLGFTRLVTSRVQTANASTDEFKAYGMGGFDPTTTLNGGLPQITFGTQSQTQYPGQTYSQIGANDWLPSKEYSNVWDFIQNLSVTRGSHALKFGAEIRQIRFPFFQVPYPHGEMYFTQTETANPALGLNNNTSGDQMASMLLGDVNWGEISTDNFISSQKWGYSFFGQDDWKVTPKLTVSVGIRYELFSPINEGFGRQSNFNFDTLTLDIPKGPDQNTALPPNFATAFPNVTVSVGQVSSYLIPWDKKDIAPRLGIAYNIRPKTVLRIGYGIFYGGEENQGGNPNRGESAPFNESPILDRSATGSPWSVNPFFTGGMQAGYPSNVFTLPAPISFRDLAQDFRNSLVHKWNLAIQQELGHQMALEVAYVGNHQAHGLLQPNPNSCPNVPALSVNCVSLEPQPDIGNLFGTASFGFGNYAGMTAKLEKRMSNGLTFLTAYTYGHALADSGTTLSGSNGLGTINPLDYNSSYSSASWDIRHNFTTSASYVIPFGKGKKFGGSMNAVTNAIAGNWQLNAVLTLHTGQPFTIDGTNCQGQWNMCRALALSNPGAPPPGGRSPSEYFNIQAVGEAPPLSAVGSDPLLAGGNLGLQSNTTPGTKNLDFNIFKDFVITERYRVQFRAEAFNLFNTPEFNAPDGSLGDAVLSSSGVPIPGEGNFGKITGTQQGTERHIQFAVRFQF
ncbi:MAG: carboxypeptidase regulatory-like domain-containing protein [Bryobacteraceae bacterium]